MEIKVEKFSSQADDLFPVKDITKLCTGYHFSEGPVWDIKTDTLYFTDFQNLHIWQWTEKDGAKLYRQNSNRSIGLSMDSRGRIVSTESKVHAITYADHEKSEVIVNAFQGKQLNSPNDVVVTKDGFVFFTDPYSEAMGGPRELDFSGVFSVSPQGEARLVEDAYKRPNGLAFSPDESLLYVNETNMQSIFVYSVGKDKATQKIGLFAQVDVSYGKGAVDGMKVDIEGNVYVTGPGGVWVFSPEATPLTILYVPENVGNLCFGGKDSKTLYITASTSVYSIETGIPGIVPFRN